MSIAIYDHAKGLLEIITDEYTSLKADGFSFFDGVTLAKKSVDVLVLAAEQLGESLSGADKKAAVLDAIGEFFDKHIKPIDIKFVPDWIESQIDAALKALILMLASRWIDKAASKLQSLGWPGVA